MAEANQEEQRYGGSALSKELPLGRTSGELLISNHRIRFQAGEVKREFPLKGTHVEEGGASNRLIFLTHTSLPGWSFFTRELSILKDPHLKADPGISAFLSSINKNRWKSKGLFWSISLTLLALLPGSVFGTYLARDYLIARVAAQIPVSWEVSLGEKIVYQAIHENSRITNPLLLKELSKITGPLIVQTNAMEERVYPYRFYVVRNPTLNAYALPGGFIVIHSALLKKAQTPEEVAGVLAHEMAHVSRQHHVRGFIDTAGLYLLIDALIGDTQGLMAVLVENSGYLLDMKFSRDYEREADETGILYMRRSHINPEGMVSFFKKLQQEEKKSSDAQNEEEEREQDTEFLNLLNTHPQTEERIENIQNKIPGFPHKDAYDHLNVDLKLMQSLL